MSKMLYSAKCPERGCRYEAAGGALSVHEALQTHLLTEHGFDGAVRRKGGVR